MESITLSQALIVGSSLTSWAEEMTSEVEGLIIGILAIIGLVVAVTYFMRNPSVGRGVIGICMGALIVSLYWLLPAVGGMIRGDIQGAGAGTSQVLVEQDTPDVTLES